MLKYSILWTWCILSPTTCYWITARVVSMVSLACMQASQTSSVWSVWGFWWLGCIASAGGCCSTASQLPCFYSCSCLVIIWMKESILSAGGVVSVPWQKQIEGRLFLRRWSLWALSCVDRWTGTIIKLKFGVSNCIWWWSTRFIMIIAGNYSSCSSCYYYYFLFLVGYHSKRLSLWYSLVYRSDGWFVTSSNVWLCGYLKLWDQRGI